MIRLPEEACKENTPLSTRFGGLEPDLVQSLAKGLAAIEAFDVEHPRMTLSEVARRIGVTPGSAQRILRTLDRLGYVGCADGHYSLRPRTLQLGYSYLASLPAVAIAQPLLTATTGATGETAYVAVLDGMDVVYVARATGRHLRRDYMSVGTRMPAHATSPGKVLLAGMPHGDRRAMLAGRKLQRLTPCTVTDVEELLRQIAMVAERGYALNDQETIMGLRSLAVPVTVGGRVVAALGTSTEVSRNSVSEMEAHFLPRLRETAVSLAQALKARDADSLQGR
ncbi:IclR family transcriptional regulator domain-containing protein [Neoroseomonas lacus]|uniref:Transcriptional regulator n=1 Tax=Neoroseomonas lacus TaxID=287609 RepID=A0A917KBH0_9PROT|nr:IclR family transcriptional regulator C-terminal domain-containing protein [Neoroseomonas lacus]GGJ05512.1 transcriptional regulator [Neoroseomonas lacus]